VERIGPYQILEELARGGMGAVFKALDPQGNTVAIKVLLSGKEASPAQRARFDREARALAKVNHPNVVRLLDVGEHGGGPYLVMDFHEEGSLEDALKKTLLSPECAARLGSQLAAGLGAVHSQGVLHRDLKPDNVLFSLNGAALLTDFGLAKDLNRESETQRLTKTGIFLGTPGFWAPEQASGRIQECGPATDVYGLGAVIYAALSGRPPIIGAGLIAILAATADERPPPLCSLRPEVPRDLESVVMRCLEKEPSARWQSARELRLALDACLHASPAPSRQELAAPLLAVIAVVAVVSGGLLATGPWNDQSSPTQPSATQPSATQPPPTQPTPSAQSLYDRGVAAFDAQRFGASAELFRRAADRGHPGGMVRLASMLRMGQGAPKDEAQAVRLQRRAAELGNPVGMYNLGISLANGSSGLAVDRAQAAEWFRRAAAKGYTSAMLDLGIMLMTGQGVARNEGEAIQWIRRAAEAGDARAMTSLGTATARGQGVPEDKAQALLWFRRAAEAGSAQGMYNLAQGLQEGHSGTKDETQALEWLRRAAEKGYSPAMFSLALSLGKGVGVPKDEKQALIWLRRAATGNDPDVRRKARILLDR
jgi:serine/threonine protein kinase/TPR repeat protein